ncbi:probable histidine biosynthesis trifunctional protein [Melanopsichium pennsylvanicum]|uniref:Histidine biosynthesis trifunctional protein n=2 Tax=Melanopsichium pennsylvanicum TaxID=63383 RepID=A0AAJ4XP62_9BASI|nr:probable histidine biosynthesis trifunctional protein [Melanopsichium pennsylvanicum 4]SNX85758.1 probable histidine biosynthesis trifunctional protein [Melanopsichium pennsylvanicum]
MQQLTIPLLPFLDAAGLQDTNFVSAVARIAPILVPQDLTSEVPANVAYLVLAQPSLTYEAAADLLDAGADAIVTADTSLIRQFDAVVSSTRFIYLSASGAAPVPELLNDVAGAVITLPTSAAISSSIQLIQTTADSLHIKTSGKSLFVLPTSGTPTISDVKAISSLNASLIAPSSILSASADQGQQQQGKLDIVDAFVAPLTSDRTDGLFATTVVSSSMSTSLGLVYSSPLSIRKSIVTGSAHYQSRNRGLWHKGESSGATQQVVCIRQDCDSDAIQFTVRQSRGTTALGFCHLENREGCFSSATGLAKLEATLRERKHSAPAASYTARLFNDASLLGAKLREEAAELADANNDDTKHVAFEAADLIYFALAKCVSAGVGLEEIEASLNAKSKKITRRKGDAKPAFAQQQKAAESKSNSTPAAAAAAPVKGADAPIKIQSYKYETLSATQKKELLKRPALRTEQVMEICRPILRSVKTGGDAALLELTEKFDKAKLTNPVRLPPFINDEVMAKIKPEVKVAIDIAYNNIHKFHKAQKTTFGNKKAASTGAHGTVEGIEGPEDGVLEVETMPGVVCRRFARPIESVGLYVPGGSAVLPSTALMLGVPAQVARCPTVVLATPPRPDGSISPEVLYCASKVNATAILCAGGAQAVAAMAYGTESCPKVDKIVGPGNQFVTAAKMLVQNETDAIVSIDMPAGPSEVLVIADGKADPAFVASDLLSQAEHGPDSQVVLVGIALTEAQLKAIEDQVDQQARALPRVDVVRQAIDKSVTIIVPTRQVAMEWSNAYAPEHLILQTEQAEELVKLVTNAGSIFVGSWSPESCGDYMSGTNHSLPTAAYAKSYSGVNVGTFEKCITSQSLTKQGLKGFGQNVIDLAMCEGLQAHAMAVKIRLDKMMVNA